MSPCHTILTRLSVLPPRAAHLALDSVLDAFQVVELAAANYDWPLFARPAQIPPSTAFSSWGVCSGRGWGKTIASVSFALGEVAARRARRIALVVQREPRFLQCGEVAADRSRGDIQLTRQRVDRGAVT